MSVSCDPLKESGRRMVSLMMWYLERDMADEDREKFRESLDRDTSYQKPKRHLKVVSNSEFTPDPRNKFKAPPGWTPPGWSDEKAYQNSLAFRKWQANPT